MRSHISCGGQVLEIVTSPDSPLGDVPAPGDGASVLGAESDVLVGVLSSEEPSRTLLRILDCTDSDILGVATW